MNVLPADILAALDVLRQAQDESDDIEFELAVELRKACQELARQSKVTADLLEMEMLRQVEGAPKLVKGVSYMAVNDYKDAFDHDSIEGRVVAEAKERALNRETGEFDPVEAARQAAHLMRLTYVSPSAKAKIGALDELGLDVKDVRQREKKGRRLHEVDTQSATE